MENVSLSDYYSEISRIRTRILSKYNHEGNNKPEQLKQQTDTQSYRHLDVKTIDKPLERKPLYPKEDINNIDDRVKKLDSVNDRIKDVLSQKRFPPSTNKTVEKYITMSKNLQNNLNLTEGKKPILKKVVSLEQNENNIIESQVIQTKTYEVNRATFGIDSQILQSESRLFKDKDLLQDEYKNNKSQFQLGHKVINKQELNKSKKQAINMSLQDFRQKYMVSIPSLMESSFEYSQENQYLCKENKNEKNIQFPLAPPRLKPSFLEKAYQQEEKVSSLSYNTNESRKLVQLLVKQVNLDIKLRQFKEQFENYNNKQKWNLLKQQLTKIHLSISPSELQFWIKIAPQEYNPFSKDSSNNSTFSMAQFAKRLIEAKQHWQQSLRQSVSIAKLEDEQFNIRELDLGEKGHLTIEDLVCFINLNSDSYLRNRDAFSMFKRWCKIQGQDSLSRDCRIRYETFLNYVTN